LMWINDRFVDGGAVFCIKEDENFLAVFVMGTQPRDCAFIETTISDLSTCSQGLTAITGPSGKLLKFR
jgi:hypothetical protein